MAMDEVTKQIREIIKQIVAMLVENDFASAVTRSANNRVSSEMIKEAIESYPGEISFPPEKSFKEIDIFKISDRSQWMADYFLWFDNEQSDLMLKVAFEEQDRVLTYGLWDIYVP